MLNKDTSTFNELYANLSTSRYDYGDILGLKVRQLNIKENFYSIKNESEGSNNNRICTPKKSSLFTQTYFVKEYSVCYGLDMLHNTALMNFLDMKYPSIEIWLDNTTEDIYFASAYYEGFKNIHQQGNQKDYAIDNVLNRKQKIEYLVASFFIGDLHTENFGIVNDEIIIIDYDDWVMKTTEHFLTSGIEFLYDFSFKDKYLTIKAGELVETAHRLEALLTNTEKLNQLKQDFEKYYGFCQQTYRHKNINPFDIVVNNTMVVAQYLKEFEKFNENKILMRHDFENAKAYPKNMKEYTKGHLRYKQEEGFFYYARKNFHALFARDFL